MELLHLSSWTIEVLEHGKVISRVGLFRSFREARERAWKIEARNPFIRTTIVPNF